MNGRDINPTCNKKHTTKVHEMQTHGPHTWHRAEKRKATNNGASLTERGREIERERESVKCNSVLRHDLSQRECVGAAGRSARRQVCTMQE